MGQSRSRHLHLQSAAASGSASTLATSADSSGVSVVGTLDSRKLVSLKKAGKKWRRKKGYSLPTGLNELDSGSQSNVSHLRRDDLVTPHKGASLLAFSGPIKEVGHGQPDGGDQRRQEGQEAAASESAASEAAASDSAASEAAAAFTSSIDTAAALTPPITADTLAINPESSLSSTANEPLVPASGPPVKEQNRSMSVGDDAGNLARHLGNGEAMQSSSLNTPIEGNGAQAETKKVAVVIVDSYTNGKKKHNNDDADNDKSYNHNDNGLDSDSESDVMSYREEDKNDKSLDDGLNDGLNDVHTGHEDNKKWKESEESEERLDAHMYAVVTKLGKKKKSSCLADARPLLPSVDHADNECGLRGPEAKDQVVTTETIPTSPTHSKEHVKALIKQALEDVEQEPSQSHAPHSLLKKEETRGLDEDPKIDQEPDSKQPEVDEDIRSRRHEDRTDIELDDKCDNDHTEAIGHLKESLRDCTALDQGPREEIVEDEETWLTMPSNLTLASLASSLPLDKGYMSLETNDPESSVDQLDLVVGINETDNSPKRPQPVGCSSDDIDAHHDNNNSNNDDSKNNNKDNDNDDDDDDDDNDNDDDDDDNDDDNDAARVAEAGGNTKRLLPSLPSDITQLERAERILQLQKVLGTNLKNNVSTAKKERSVSLFSRPEEESKVVQRKSSHVQQQPHQYTRNVPCRSKSFSHVKGNSRSNSRSNNTKSISNADPTEAFRSWLQRKGSNVRRPSVVEEWSSEVKTSGVVHEVERLRREREARRARQAELLDAREARRSLDPGNPNVELLLAIMAYQEQLDFRPLSFNDSVVEHQITVCIRKRPLNPKETRRKEVDVVTCPNRDQVVVHEPKTKVDLTKYLDNHHFRFDYAFDQRASNQLVYRYTAGPLVRNLFSGGFSTCFAYGQTGSGKTHTMGGAFEGRSQNVRDGIYIMAADDVFDIIHSNCFRHLGKLSVGCSFFEIYSGKVFDLLHHKSKLRVLEDGRGQVVVQGLSEQLVQSSDDVLRLINRGNALRTSGQTSSNVHSSRSHAVFQIVLRVNKRVHGKFSLIDLAGNERGMDTASADRHTRIEGAEINKSLLALKECIRALGRRGAPHLPFRASKLTQVLRDSFIGEKSKTCMIAMVSPGMGCCEHTLNTLRYADRVKELGADDPATAVKMISEESKEQKATRSEEAVEVIFDQDAEVVDVEAALAAADSSLGLSDSMTYLEEDLDLVQLGSLNSMGSEWLSLQEALLGLEESEERLLDAHHSLIDGMRVWVKEDVALLHLTDHVDYDQETYCRQLERLVDTKINTLNELKRKAKAFHSMLEREEAISKIGQQLKREQS